MRKIIIFLFSFLILLSLTSCPDESEEEETTTENQTPVVEDFNIEGIGTFTFERNVTHAVTITPKEGKTTGKINIRYNNSVYANGPSAEGVYVVTFNVEAAEGWNAANGLVAGTLEINQFPTPKAADYTIAGTGEFVYDGETKAVTVTRTSSASTGAVTIYYNGDKNAPSALGRYTVTFDVAKVPGAEGVQEWNAAYGLAAGTLTIFTATPKEEDYIITGLENAYTYDGSAKEATVTPKTGVGVSSPGAVTVWYEGAAGNSAPYAKKTAAPSAVGTYTVTFDVAAATGWFERAGLSAGLLTISPPANSGPYTVTFASNGGPDVAAVTNVPHGGSIPEPAEIFKTLSGNDISGKHAGWYKESALTNIWHFDGDTVLPDVVTSDITLYAKWRAYEVLDGGPAGGIIFYRDPQGFTVKGYTNAGGTVVWPDYRAHYLEDWGGDYSVPPTHPLTHTNWASPAFANTLISPSASGTYSIGYGRYNTAVILAKDPDAPAAKACADYRGGGKDDWFLPSAHELNPLMDNLYGKVPVVINSHNWSSTEYDASNAFHRFYADSTYRYVPKYGTNSYRTLVRAVRAF